MGKLDSKTIIITGAAGGIGSAITIRCLQDGATVLGCDRNRLELEKLRERVQSEKLSTFQVDVSSYSEVEALFKQIVKDFPQTDCLVNNAGIYFGKNILDYTAEPGTSFDPLLVDFLVDNATSISSVKGRNKFEGGQVSLAVVLNILT